MRRLDEADEEFVVPCGNLAAQTERVLAIGPSNEVERHVFERSEGGGAFSVRGRRSSSRNTVPRIQGRLGDGRLAADGLDRYHSTSDGQHLEEHRDGDNLVGLVDQLNLTQHHALTNGDGRDHIRRVSCHAIWAAHSLAINSHRSFEDPDQGRHPPHKAALECFGVEGGLKIAEMVIGLRNKGRSPKMIRDNCCCHRLGWSPNHAAPVRGYRSAFLGVLGFSRPGQSRSGGWGVR